MQPTEDDPWAAWWADYGRRVDGRFRAAERRIEADRAQLERLRVDVGRQLDSARRELATVVLLGLLGSVVCTGLLCLGTIVLLL